MTRKVYPRATRRKVKSGLLAVREENARDKKLAIYIKHIPGSVTQPAFGRAPGLGIKMPSFYKRLSRRVMILRVAPQRSMAKARAFSPVCSR